MYVVILYMEIISPLIFYNVFLKYIIDKKNRTIFSDWKMYIVISLIYTSIFYVLAKQGVSNILLLMSSIFIYSFIFYRVKGTKFLNNVIIMLVSTVLTFLSEVPSGIVVSLISRNGEIRHSLAAITALPFIMINILLLDKFLSKKSDIILKSAKKYSWVSLVIINSFIFSLFFKILINYSLANAKIVIQVGTIIVILISSNMLYITNLYKARQKEKQEEIKVNINPLIDDLLNKMKAREHEYKNHLNILYCMIQVCKQDELKERARAYIGNVMEDDLLSKVTSIENTIVKAILFSKLQQVEKEKINYTFEIDSNLDKIPLDDSELTVVLSNLLNNAIEAISEIENKKIEIYIGEQHNKHVIKVKNSTSGITKDMFGEIFKEGFSTKGDNRGYGLYNIKSIVEKHKGKIELELDNDMLEFNIFV